MNSLKLKRLKEAYQKAERENSQKTFFLACMSHEIRTPLNSIIGVVDLLKEKESELDPEARQLVNMAQASCDTLLSIINNVLDFSRIEVGEVHLEKVLFSLSEELNVCVSMTEFSAKKKNIRLQTNVENPSDDSFEGDPIRLRQILLNLLSNAIKFSERGTISINVRKLESQSITSDQVQLLFSITDQGIGIPSDQKDMVFDFFKQANGSINRKFGGTGLGLSITKKLVELMGGKIWVESVLGQGSTFCFTILLNQRAQSINLAQP